MMHRTAGKQVARATILALLALSLVACGDDDPMMPVIVIDAGTDMGAMPVDMGTPPVDMGPACAPDPLTPLPAEALPRCTAATQAAVIACGVPTSMAIVTCINNAVAADTTPAFGTPPNAVNCAACFNYQMLACFYEAGCNDEFDAFQCCVTAEGCADPNACPACGTELTAFQTCAGGVADCFDASMGFPDGCFAEAGTDGGVPMDGGPAVDGGADVDGGPAVDGGP